ncbi:MAG: VOC family protein [Candidatus Promineifilaceae bacterium]
MKQAIMRVALVVRDYDEAIAFFCHKLHFTLIEDSYQPEQDKRWVLVAPPGSSGTALLLARAATPEQEAFIGRQTGGRVFLFLSTDNFWRDYTEMLAAGIRFVRAPQTAAYGTVAVFEDLYGNLWDLIEPK